MAQNPRWLIKQAPGDLKAQISIAVSRGYHVVSQTATTAQLIRQKTFSCLIATLALLLFGFPFIIYLFYYLSKKDDTVYLDIETQPSVADMKKEAETFKAMPWYKKHPVWTGVLGFFAFTFIISLFSSGNDPKREIQVVFDVPSLMGKNLEELKSTLGTPAEETNPPALQIQNGTTGEEYISWEKDGAGLMVFYEYKTKKINDYFVTVGDGATRDKGLLLGVSDLKEGADAYGVEFVQVINPPTPGLYTGVKVTPK